MNVVEKSKLDWTKYTKEEKLEAELEKNRKDGFLAKRKFIEAVQDKEYEHKKQVERAAIQSKKL